MFIYVVNTGCLYLMRKIRLGKDTLQNANPLLLKIPRQISSRAYCHNIAKRLGVKVSTLGSNGAI